MSVTSVVTAATKVSLVTYFASDPINSPSVLDKPSTTFAEVTPGETILLVVNASSLPQPPRNLTISSSSIPSSATTPSQTSPAGGKGSRKIPAGPAAGIGIGCAIGGAFLAALVFFLMSSRKHRHRPHREKDAYNDGYGGARGQSSGHSKSEAITTFAIPTESSAAIVENGLPQPLEDNAISGEFSKIRDKINGHIQSYYHSGPANDTASAKAITQTLGTALPIRAESLPGLLANPKSRTAVLRLALASIIVSRLDLHCPETDTFLPPQVGGCVATIPQMQMSDKIRMAFFSKWRTITAALLEPIYGGTALIAPTDARNTNIQKAVQAANSILQPYAGEQADEQVKRLKNLEEIMRRAARFAFVLFSQPSFWGFDWQAPADGVVLFPALLQLTDEAGKLLGRPRPFGNTVVAAL